MQFERVRRRKYTKFLVKLKKIAVKSFKLLELGREFSDTVLFFKVSVISVYFSFFFKVFATECHLVFLIW